MNIAHYTFRNPFTTKGGQTRYVRDLVTYQRGSERNDELFVLFPDRSSYLRPKPHVIKKRNNRGAVRGITFLGIRNYTPSTLFEGTRYPKQEISWVALEEAVVNTIRKEKIEVLHFHTFFGITAGTVEKIKKLGCRTAYTSHDYQPLCPLIMMMKKNPEGGSTSVCTDMEEGRGCVRCCAAAPPRKRIKLRDSSIGKLLQKSDKLKYWVKKRKQINMQEPVDKRQVNSVAARTGGPNAEAYRQRRLAFLDVLRENIDTVIFTSPVTEEQYRKNGYTGGSVCMPVSTLEIADHHFEEYSCAPSTGDGPFRFGYLGGRLEEKGYEDLLAACTDLHKTHTNWDLKLFGLGAELIAVPEALKKNVRAIGFTDGPFSQFDVLVVPSRCMETFSFSILEALVRKKGIIAADTVGAARYLEESGIAVYSTREELTELLRKFVQQDNETPVQTIRIDADKKNAIIRHFARVREVYGG